MSESTHQVDYCKEHVIDSINTDVICKSSSGITSEQRYYNRKVALYKLKKGYEEQVAQLKKKIKDKEKLKEAITEAEKEYKYQREFHIPIKLTQRERDAGWQVVEKKKKSWKEICNSEYKRWKKEDYPDLMKYGMNYKRMRRKDPKSKFFSGRREEEIETLE